MFDSVTLWTVLTCLINLLSTVTLWGKYHFITLRSQLKPGHISSKCQRWDLNQDLPTIQISSLLADKRETLGSFPAVPWLSIPALFWASLVAQMVKTLPAQETWVRKITRRRKRLPTQYSCLVNPMDRGAWWATVHGFAESNMTEWITLSLYPPIIFHDVKALKDRCKPSFYSWEDWKPGRNSITAVLYH